VTAVSQSTVWLEKIQTLAPIIEQYRDESEKQRHLAPPVYEAMRELGLFKLWVPRNLGGEEQDFRTVFEVVERVASFDGSAGWLVAVGVELAWLLGYLPEDVAAQIVADDPDATYGGAGNPLGIATPVEGGYRVTGQWRFGSGSKHTRWLWAGCTIKDGDDTRLNENGTPQLYFFGLRSDQYEVVDTWYTSGLRATGSNDFRVRDLFVPERLMIGLQAKKSAYQSGTLYQTGFIDISGWPMAVVGLGVAVEAIDAFAELAATKVPNMGSRRIVESDHVQMILGRALAKLNSGREYLLAILDRFWAAMEAGNGDDALSIELWLATANAADCAADAVDLVRSLAGTSGVFQGNKLERCWRDVHMVTQHAQAASANYVAAGAYRLGLGVKMLGRS